MLPLHAQMWGKVAQGPGLCEFSDDFRTPFAQRVSRPCAAGRARVGVPKRRTGSEQAAKSSAVPDGGKNEGLRQGAIPHSETKLREEVAEVLQPSALTGSRFADEAHQGALVGHEVSLQDGHVTSVLPMHRHVLESEVFQKAVATLG